MNLLQSTAGARPTMGLLVGLATVILAGWAVVSAPSALVLVAAGILAPVSAGLLLNLGAKAWWITWLAVVALSAFGPFLDLITGMPVNWVIGMLVLMLCGVMIVRLAVTRSSRVVPRAGRSVPPVLGIAYALYLVYLFLQSLRPDVDLINTVLGFRAPLIGIAAYLLTLYVFRNRMTRAEIAPRLQAFLTLCMIVGVIVGAYGLFQFLIGYDRLQALGLIDPNALPLHNQRNLGEGTTIFRIFSTLRRNEVLGVFLYLNVVASAFAAQLRVTPRWWPWLSLTLSLVVMLLALSLTSIVSLMIWIGLVVLASGSRKFIWRTILAATVGLVVLLLVNYLLGGLLWTRVQEHVLDAGQGIGRLQMFENWIRELAGRSPGPLLLGTGVCTGLDEDALGRIGTVLQSLGLHVGDLFQCGWQLEIHDNWFATHSLEIGLVGLLLFWLIFAALALVVLPELKRRWEGAAKSGWILFGTGLLALWFSGFVGALLLYMPITLYFWSFMALLDVATRPSRHSALPPEHP